MIGDKAPVIPLHLHPGFQDWRRVNKLKTALMSESLAYVQVALDNAAGPGGASPRAIKILERACALLDEARNQLVHELL
ncbi:MAG: hypothetical protein Q7O12_05470 [Deltaproteobacteria bacterium]|nr:hypothetical protein [Deltaproteobacteria bacterium]